MRRARRGDRQRAGEPERAVVPQRRDPARRREAVRSRARSSPSTSARVELRGGVSAFLDREPDGWRITAVGCRAARTAARPSAHGVRGGGLVRTLFAFTLVLVFALLAYAFVIGALGAVRRWVRENSLALFFLGSSWRRSSRRRSSATPTSTTQQLAHQDDPISLWRYVTSSAFGVDVMENWQSEYLQFTLFILATVWLLQRGSPESKPLGRRGRRVRRGAEGRRARAARTRRAGPAPAAGARGCTPTRCCSSWPRSGSARWFAQSSPAASPTTPTSSTTTRRALSSGSTSAAGLLEPHAAELAVGVPRRRLDGRLLDLPAPARLARVQAGRRAARRPRARRASSRASRSEAAEDRRHLVVVLVRPRRPQPAWSTPPAGG